MKTPPRRPLPFAVRRRLAALRWSIRAYVLLEAIAIAAIWLGATFWVALAMDYLPVLAGASELPRGVRALVLVVIGAVLAWLLYRWLLTRALAQLRNEHLALLLERRFPEFHDALVTMVELSSRPDHAESFSEQMLEETRQEALAKLPQVRLLRVFRMRPLGTKLITAALLALTVVAFWKVESNAFGIWVRRLYMLDEELWPRRSHIEVVGIEVVRDELAAVGPSSDVMPFEDGRIKVAKGSALKLLVHADADKKIPQRCVIYYRTAEGDRGSVVMKQIGQVTGGVQRYEFDGKPFRGVLSDITFDVRGGDHRVRDLHIEVVNSPAVVKTELACVFPDYLVDEQTSTWMPRTLPLTSGLQLPQGTEVVIELTANKPLEHVEWILPGATPEDPPTRGTVPVPGDGERSMRVTLPAQRLGDQLTMDVILHDRDGVYSEEPHHIVVLGITDQPPRVQVSLQGIGTAITPQAVLPFAGTVTDDYRVDRMWVEVVTNAEQTHEIPISAVAGEEVRGRIDFRDLQMADTPLTIKPKDKLSVTVRAADRYNLDGQSPNVGNGDRFQLDVVTEEELLAMLDRRELNLRRRFEQIIDEMTQLRDSLVRVVTDRPDSADDVPLEPGEETESLSPEQRAARLRALNVLRAQRALSQSEKSAQEIIGVAASFDDIRLEIDNNRIDAADRQERLKTQISEPLQLVASTLFPQLDEQLRSLQSALEAAEPSEDLAAAARQQADDILIELDKVLQKMLELEDYNALVQLVRRLLDEQRELAERTKALRKKKALDLLK